MQIRRLYFHSVQFQVSAHLNFEIFWLLKAHKYTHTHTYHIMEREEASSRILISKFFLDHVGEVSLTLNSDGLSWTKPDSLNKNVCFNIFYIPYVYCSCLFHWCFYILVAVIILKFIWWVLQSLDFYSLFIMGYDHYCEIQVVL